MLRIKLLFFFTLFLFSIVPNFTPAQNIETVPGELIVKLKGSFKNFEQPHSNASSKIGIESLDAINQAHQLRQIKPLFKKKRSQQNLNRIITLRFPGSTNIDEIILKYKNDPNIEYVQPNYVHKIHFTPNDSLFAQQEALQIVQAEQAWNIQLASSDIIIGLIDTGIDYEHNDLRDAIWINPGEDLNANGQVDSSDFNGIDDDENGFVDDIQGWDFTDAPTFPDGGDFEIPDNDPFDENGHGTSVAGIIGATGNNGIGIAGLAFGSKIMNLRAGTSLGFLEEDDVASAIVYAVENGARIINMSFGDVVASPLLQDVMQYAAEQNCVLVASAGNSNTDKIHFPSGFVETISVGATDKNDNLAGFSNYGSSVDVVAPGVNILTTQRGNSYRNFSGTSASAPFVSALAALILSKTPQLSNESVKGLIMSSADDFGEIGWDNFFASGRINAFRAISSPYFSVAQITRPALDQGFASGPIEIHGTARGAFLEEFVLELGVGETPDEWAELHQQKNRQVIDELIMNLDISVLEDTVHTLRLIVRNKNQSDIEDKLRFFIDRTPPAISEIKQTEMIEAEKHGFLLEFTTDDLCDAVVHFRPKNSSEQFNQKELRFRTQTHRVFFSQDIFVGEMEFFIEVTNSAGLSSTNDNFGELFTADLSAPAIGGAPIDNFSVALPSGFLLNKSADFDGDGFKEVILSQYENDFNFGSMKIFEINNDIANEVFSTQEIFIPRDWGDSDGDGLLEIFAGFGPQSFIFEASPSNSFPTQMVFTDTVWASRFADLDQDGKGELVIREGDVFALKETVGDNRYERTASFPNPTEGGNTVGVPHSEIGDFDGDGHLEILFGDFDGDVYIYENIGDDLFEFTWSDRLPLIDTIDYLTAGDYDGDGITEFVVGSHSDPNLNTESTFDSRHWLYRVYKKRSDNDYEVAWEQAFFGFQSPGNFDSGVSSGDIDNDGLPEILIHVFPDFYIVDYNLDYQIVWHSNQSRSNTTIVADLNGDKGNEFLFNSGDEIKSFKYFSNFRGPTTPLAVKARPLGVNLVEVSWQSSEAVDKFQIYRGPSPDNLAAVAETSTSPFLDNTVLPDSTYFYSVSAIDSLRTPTESLLSPPVKVTPGEKPFVQRANYLASNQIQIFFSEAMSNSVSNQTNYEISSVGTPSSAISHKAGKEVILTSPTVMQPSTYQIIVRNVTDKDGTPIDSTKNRADFEVVLSQRAPYLVNASLVGPNQLLLEFSESMDALTVSEIGNYQIEPTITVVEAKPSTESNRFVVVTIDSNSPIGPFGIDYFITVRNVKSANGVAIKFGEGDTAALIFSSSDLSNIFAYPNPYRGDMQQDYITIAGLTSRADIKIFDVSGRLIRSFEESDGNGGARWDLRDESGNRVPSGIYIFLVESDLQKAVGKLAVIR